MTGELPLISHPRQRMFRNSPIAHTLRNLTGKLTGMAGRRSRRKPGLPRPTLELLERREVLTNSLPVAVDDFVTVNEDSSVNIYVLANDSDPDGDPLTPWAVDGVVHGTLAPQQQRDAKQPQRRLLRLHADP